VDGDLGPYEVIDIRLEAADTVVFLAFSPLRLRLAGRPLVAGAC